jgi:peptidoglycan/LPS O-acetylase OafA/YrhL
MTPLNPIFAALALSVAIATAFGIKKSLGAPGKQGRFVSIDGLRGYLAFFVFLHHSAVWYFYLRTGNWKVPPSNLFTHFGETSVMLFFMITGFLFYTKLLDSKHRGLNWGSFFVSRILRLVPLYFFAMGLLFVIVAFRSNGAQNDSVLTIAKTVGEWLAFTIPGAPDINQVDSRIIMAGVTWSLPYEWFFYLALPVIALSVRVIPPIPYLLVGIIGLAFASTRGLSSHCLLAFSAGIGSALIVRLELFQRVANHNLSSVIALACLVIAVTFYRGAYGIPQIVLLSFAFSLIAGGSGLFGILTNETSRTFGEMAYSIYLLHGIVLFLTFNYVVGIESVRQMTPTAFWMMISGITPVLLLICLGTFKFIEAPAMRQVPVVMAWFRRSSPSSTCGESSYTNEQAKGHSPD